MLHDLLMSAKAPEGEPPEAPARWVTAQHEGRLLLFYPTGIAEGIKTSQGVSDAVECSRIIDLDTGEIYRDARVFGVALLVNLKVAIPDQAVCGRLAKSSRGAWIIAPHSAEELDTAQKWISEDLA